MFNEIDDDQNGYLDKDEVRTMYARISTGEEASSEQEVEQLWNELDTSGNEKVTETEFIEYFEKHKDDGGGVIGKYFHVKEKKERKWVKDHWATFEQRVRLLWKHTRDLRTFTICVCIAYIYVTLITRESVLGFNVGQFSSLINSRLFNSELEIS
eukprot:SAG11_NODE_8062_length_1064_cov_0.564767_1_plen_154_part_10